MRPAVFLDRDGVINRSPGPGKFLLHWEAFEFMPGVKQGLSHLRKAGFGLVLITNQSGVGRGLMTLAELDRIHEQMQRALGRDRLDGLYVCPHHPDAGCPCRKPSPDMIERACVEHHLDAGQSFMIGDSERDIAMGRAARCRTVLCRENLPPSIESMNPRHQPDVFTRTFLEAVDWILSRPAAASQ